MKTLHHLAAAALLLALTGCVSFNPAGPIGDPAQKAAQTQPRAAMIEDVAITDGKIDEALRKTLSAQFTQQLIRRVERGEYFEELISFPATLGEQDVALQFTFTSLQGKRTPHPGYFPGALLTLTIWIWVNGPIYVDKYDVAGSLEIVDASGKVLASSEQAIKLQQNTGLWDSDYFNMSLGSDQLNQLVEQLLQDGTRKLPHP
ncbi:hypothetical protein [Phytopseudomonas dryadis]|uniref:Lipoprotein n=1 Tax=Phytopseudomonas dryadis TaxID=2487520 RepID=A0A4Q9QW57_9GAMM|nr:MULTISPECIES: hypothetical protein [Pseudomonas]TBU88323.1 hypothetical protein DNK44_18845 [Pseudomonas dryadis]TBV01778.1 hypothetical protein DNK34_20205 [Pseudomonas dryadis]TBV14398.1 hypothetical protein DNK41_20145 [Pseudomonas sp. FRB 230]